MPNFYGITGNCAGSLAVVSRSRWLLRRGRSNSWASAAKSSDAPSPPTVGHVGLIHGVKLQLKGENLSPLALLAQAHSHVVIDKRTSVSADKRALVSIEVIIVFSISRYWQKSHFIKLLLNLPQILVLLPGNILTSILKLFGKKKLNNFVFKSANLL